MSVGLVFGHFFMLHCIDTHHFDDFNSLQIFAQISLVVCMHVLLSMSVWMSGFDSEKLMQDSLKNIVKDLLVV